jgi:hypothetical protein
VCHIRDLEVDGYQARFRRVLEEHEPALVSIDGYELAERRGYADADPREALAAFRSARAETLALLLRLDAPQLARRGSFAEYGQVSLLGLIHFLRSHDQQHLACFQWLLGKYASEVSGGAAPPA